MILYKIAILWRIINTASFLYKKFQGAISLKFNVIKQYERYTVNASNNT